MSSRVLRKVTIAALLVVGAWVADKPVLEASKPTHQGALAMVGGIPGCDCTQEKKECGCVLPG